MLLDGLQRLKSRRDVSRLSMLGEINQCLAIRLESAQHQWLGTTDALCRPECVRRLTGKAETPEFDGRFDLVEAARSLSWSNMIVRYYWSKFGRIR